MTEEKKKELYDLVEKIVYPSWTWAKLTYEEKDRFNSAVYSIVENGLIQGTLKQKKSIVTSLYKIFLIGVGYSDWNWRE